MDIYRMLRYFARTVILTPLAVIMYGLICTYLPWLADFLSNIFWGVLGETEIFSLASGVIEGGLSYSHFSVDNFFAGFLALLFGALSDAAIMGFCVFMVKSTHVFFNRTWHGSFTRPVWALTLTGVILGVVICGLKVKLAALGQSLLTLGVCLGCYIFGIALMLRGPKLTKHGTYSNRRAGFIIKMMLGIIGNMFDAFCGVFILTAIMEGPRLMKMGGSFVVWLAWIGLSVALLVLKNMLTQLMQPDEV